MGIYSDMSGSPDTRMGLTQTTLVNANEGWQTIALSAPLNVTAGQTIWLAWVFQSNPGVRYTIGSPGRASSPNTWSSGMPVDFSSSNIANYKYSVYCSYTMEGNTVFDTLGNIDVFNYVAYDNNLRAMPVRFTQNSTVNSISIYHEGGTGSMLLGVYADQTGSPSSRLESTQTTLVNSNEGWQTVALSTPVNVTAGQTIWLAWIFQNNPGVRYSVGTPGRASAKSTWSSGLPSDFGSSNIAGYKYSIYCTYFSSSALKDASITENGNLTQSQEVFSNGNGKSEITISDINAEFDFTVYPNPSSSFVNIDFSYIPEVETRIVIIDNSGRSIINKLVESSSNRIDINQFSSGLYFVKIINRDYTNTKKLIIKR
jgi:hypothetical protein